MRTLSAELLAAQKTNVIPYIKAIITDGVTTYTFDNVGYSGADNRIISITTVEEPFGGNAIIRLKNSDKYFADKNLNGMAVTLGWGAKLASTYEVSNQAPLFVYNQQDISVEGELITELTCLDYWWKLAYTIIARAGELVVGEIDGTFEIGEVVTSSPDSYTAKLVDIGYDNVLLTSLSTSFSGQTTLTGGTSSATLTIDSVTTATNAYGTDFTRDETIFEILQSITTGILDGVVIDSDAPSGDNKVNEYQPLLLTPINYSSRAIIRQMLLKTPCVGVIKNDNKLHILYPDPEGAVDYTYYNDHLFWSSARERAITIPNTVAFVNSLDPNFWELYGYYSGTASDTDSVALLGELGTIQTDNTIESDDEAEKLASAWITNKQTESNQGSVLAPMNCGQELYDQTSIIDERSNIIITGRVGRIVRTYQSSNTESRYDIEISLGGIASEPGSIGGPNTLEMDLEDMTTDVIGGLEVKPKLPPTPPWDTILPRAIQGYSHDITFYITDWDTVAWTGGTITFYDGTTQAVSAWNTGNLQTDGIYVVYFDLVDAHPNVLKVALRTTYYSTIISESTGTLCLVQRCLTGSGTGHRATMLPSFGKEPYISTDWIDMAGFKEWVDPETGDSYSAILTTDISAGHIYISSATVFASGYDPSDKEQAVAKQASAPSSPSVGDLWLETDVTPNVLRRWTGSAWVKAAPTTYRQHNAPSSGMATGDLWIDTSDGDKPYTYNGSSWIASYTSIDGGNIKTGTIDCSLVTVRSSSSEEVVITDNGITIKGDGIMTFYHTNYSTSWIAKMYLTADSYGGNYTCGLYGYNNMSVVLKQNGTMGRILLEASNDIYVIANNDIVIGGAGETYIISGTLNLCNGTVSSAYVYVTIDNSLVSINNSNATLQLSTKSSTTNATIWYDSGTGTFKGRAGGSTKTFNMS